MTDKDARVGRKSRGSSFYGYKMAADERLITSVETKHGAYVDGAEFGTLLDRTKESGVGIKEVYGDKAYFRPAILQRIREEGAEPYIPVSEMAYRVDEALFSYNKDSDQWFCVMGNETISRKRRDAKRGEEKRSYLVDTFQKTLCEHCLRRDECMGKAKTKARSIQVSIHTAELYELSQRQKDPMFLEKYKKRAAQEWKNGEMKRFHGLAQARGFGLRSVAIQAKLTAITVNLKRIASLAAERNGKSGRSSGIFSGLTALFLPLFTFSRLRGALVLAAR